MSWHQMWKNIYLRFWRIWSNKIWPWEKWSLKFTSNLSAGGFINCSDRKWDALLIRVSWKSPSISMESEVSVGSQVRVETPHPQVDLTFLAQHQVCGTDFRSICRICVYICVHNFCLLATKWPFLKRFHPSLQNYEKQYRDYELPVFGLSLEREKTVCISFKGIYL